MAPSDRLPPPPSPRRSKNGKRGGGEDASLMTQEVLDSDHGESSCVVPTMKNGAVPYHLRDGSVSCCAVGTTFRRKPASWKGPQYDKDCAPLLTPEELQDSDSEAILFAERGSCGPLYHRRDDRPVPRRPCGTVRFAPSIARPTHREPIESETSVGDLFINAAEALASAQTLASVKMDKQRIPLGNFKSSFVTEYSFPSRPHLVTPSKPTPLTKKRKESATTSGVKMLQSEVFGEIEAQALARKIDSNPALSKRVTLSMACGPIGHRPPPETPPGRGAVIEEGFSWSTYPPLETLIRSHMREYHELRIDNHDIDQAAFNEKMINRVRALARENGWDFHLNVDDNALRVRIRAFLNMRLQNAKARLQTLIKNPTKKKCIKTLHALASIVREIDERSDEWDSDSHESHSSSNSVENYLSHLESDAANQDSAVSLTPAPKEKSRLTILHDLLLPGNERVNTPPITGGTSEPPVEKPKYGIWDSATNLLPDVLSEKDPLFPKKVFKMVTETSKKKPSVISWTSDGSGFFIKDEGHNLSPILRKHFRHSKYSLLLKQLHNHGWKRNTRGKFKGAFHHPSFRRDKGSKHSLKNIKSLPEESRQKDKVPRDMVSVPSRRKKKTPKWLKEYQNDLGSDESDEEVAPDSDNADEQEDDDSVGSTTMVDLTSSEVRVGNVTAQPKPPPVEEVFVKQKTFLPGEGQKAPTGDAFDKYKGPPFPETVFALVSDTAQSQPSVIDWVCDGEAFVVKDTGSALSSILGKYFDHSKYSSFQRQLNMYGFKKHTTGKFKGCFQNDHFHRDRGSVEELALIKRRPPPPKKRRRLKEKGSGEPELHRPRKRLNAAAQPDESRDSSG